MTSKHEKKKQILAMFIYKCQRDMRKLTWASKAGHYHQHSTPPRFLHLCAVTPSKSKQRWRSKSSISCSFQRCVFFTPSPPPPTFTIAVTCFSFILFSFTFPQCLLLFNYFFRYFLWLRITGVFQVLIFSYQ